MTTKTVIKKSKLSWVEERYWGPGDSYNLVKIGDIQVFPKDGFRSGDIVEVEITITKT